jgi:hypothetical protein
MRGLLVVLLAAVVDRSLSQVVINEVSDAGSPGFCDGDDWVELVNTGTSSVDMTGWMLCDSDGCGDTDKYTFGAVTIAAGQYLAVCHVSPVAADIRRWISKNDTITLFEADGTTEVDTSGVLGNDGIPGQTWARLPDSTGTFTSTSFATPNAANEGPGDVCDKLALEGHNCSACVDDDIDPFADESCTSTAEDDYELEKTALFGSRDPPNMWMQTEFLFKDETVWQFELVLDQVRERTPRNCALDHPLSLGLGSTHPRTCHPVPLAGGVESHALHGR